MGADFIMKEIHIYCSGKSYHADKRLGKYTVLLVYKTKIKSVEYTSDYTTTMHRIILQGLIDAVSLLKEPCEVELITKMRVGIKYRYEQECPNRDLIHILLNLLKAKRHKFSFKVLGKLEYDTEIKRILE